MQDIESAAHGGRLDLGAQTSPLGSIRQAFWLIARRERAAFGAAPDRRIWIWIEAVSGELLALSLLDVDEEVTELLVSLASALDPPTTDWDVLRSRFASSWLIAPDFRGSILVDAPLEPDKELLDEALAWVDPQEATPPSTSCLAHFRNTVRSFIAGLDRLVLRQLGRWEPRLPRIRDYNRFICWPQPQRRYRLQAIWEFPWIEELFRDRNTTIDAQGVARLGLTIDRAEPLLPAIAQAFGVRPAAIRRMRQASGLTPNLAWARCLAWIFEAGFPSPGPSDDEVDWVEMLLHAVALSGWLQDRELTMGLARCLDPDRMRSLLRRAQEDELHSNLLAEVLSQYGQHLDPSSRRRGLDRLRGMLLSDGVARTLHAIACWLDIAARFEPDGEGASWQGLFEGPVHLDDLVAVELLSAEALQHEGAAMDHCVAGRWRPCLRGASRVFSVRRLDGSHVSTLELVVDQENVLCLEHRGRNNESPPLAAVRVEHHLRLLIHNAVAQERGTPASA